MGKIYRSVVYNGNTNTKKVVYAAAENTNKATEIILAHCSYPGWKQTGVDKINLSKRKNFNSVTVLR